MRSYNMYVAPFSDSDFSDSDIDAILVKLEASCHGILNRLMNTSCSVELPSWNQGVGDLKAIVTIIGTDIYTHTAPNIELISASLNSKTTPFSVVFGFIKLPYDRFTGDIQQRIRL